MHIKGLVFFLIAGFNYSTAFSNSKTESSLPQLSWQNSIQTDNESRYIQFSKSINFDSIDLTKITTTNQIEFKSTLDGSYYWRVVTKDGEIISSPKEINLVDYFADDDKDGLENGWEMNGYAGIDLPGMGADHKHKDLFVFMDFMRKNLLPSDNGFEVIKDIFEDAPVSNPDGEDGIKLHLTLANRPIRFETDMGKDYWNKILAHRNRALTRDKMKVYHYMIWANKYNNGTSSGVSLGAPARDFIVSLGGWGTNNTESARIGTFIHELGHNLGLRHGGADNDNWKPNYISVMNYTFQIDGVTKDRKQVFDYQRFRTLTLDENRLSERDGIGRKAADENYGTIYQCNGKGKTVTDLSRGIDWNCNNSISGTVSIDINKDKKRTRLKDFDDWKNVDIISGRQKSFSSFRNLSKAEKKIISDELTLNNYLRIQNSLLPNE